MSNSWETAVFATACAVLLVLVSASRPVTNEVQPLPWCSACDYLPAMRLHTLLGWVGKATKPALTPQPLCGQGLTSGRQLLQGFGSNTLDGFRPGLQSGNPCPAGTQHCNSQNACLNLQSDSLNCGACPWVATALTFTSNHSVTPCLQVACLQRRRGVKGAYCPLSVQGAVQMHATSTQRPA